MNQADDVPVYYDGSMHPEAMTSQAPGAQDETSEKADGWAGFIGANPYEFEMK
ncbi:hypothetical protein [Cohnella candidum]|uniref:hypothetical protein n=1 Tax=Cohnella candidum TaxID=2674991 RepID=UPI0013DDACA8|nr:hypothetical protein [Cohnella candidum]